MARVVFWSPETNMTGNTHVAVAVATMMGISHKASCLIMNGHFNSRKIETSYTPYYELKESGALENSNIGIGALIRLVVSNKLTADVIKNYAKPVLKERLDVLYGMSGKDKDQHAQMHDSLQYITRKADEVYDIVFIDLPKASNEQYIKDILNDADIVVCIVNQDVLKLDEFFDLIANEEELKNKSKIYVVGDYESKSKYNVVNIKNKYRIKDPIYTVPHNYLFSDACNDGNVIDFFYKNINIDSKDYNGKFLFEALNIAERILELAKIKDV
ncbi:MAG: hypothetical protein N2749_07015 [Clostridia bacterium]|nr:hypothetical protein [Clostridia bacterium]